MINIFETTTIHFLFVKINSDFLLLLTSSAVNVHSFPKLNKKPSLKEKKELSSNPVTRIIPHIAIIGGVNMTICVNQIHPFESLVKLNHVPQVLVVKIPWFTSTLQRSSILELPRDPQTNRHHQDSDISSRGVPTNLHLPLESCGPGW